LNKKRQEQYFVHGNSCLSSQTQEGVKTHQIAAVIIHNDFFCKCKLDKLVCLWVNQSGTALCHNR